MAEFTLVCRRCETRAENRMPFACPACGGPLDTIVEIDRAAADAVLSRPSHRLWEYEPLLPSPPGPQRPSLGEGETALLRLDRVCEAIGLPGLLLKNEGMQPTHSYKDRYQVVSVAHAAALGAAGVVCMSTGNHGFSAACYSALCGLPCIVYVHPEAPEEMRLPMRAVGATVEALEPADRARVIGDLMAAGWYPSTTSSFVPVATPFGIEGYKTLAYELVRQCGGRAPDWVLVPVGAGDGLAGIWRGFKDLLALGRIDRAPHMVACQPTGANPVILALEHGLDEPPVLEVVTSIALSIRDAEAGGHVMTALRESAGTAVAVEDEEIVEAARLLALCGLLVDPASATPLAAARRLREQIGSDTAVCILTATGERWPVLLEKLAGKIP
jgi:threonine synthase